MTYYEFIKDVSLWLSGTTISGSTQTLFIKECLVDEIELSEIDYSPDFRIYITPLPITIDNDNRATYSCQVYIVSDIGLSPMIPDSGETITRRFVEYNNCVNFFQAFIQQIPSDGVPDFTYPITGTFVQLWDMKYDGIYFDLSMTTGVDCI